MSQILDELIDAIAEYKPLGVVVSGAIYAEMLSYNLLTTIDVAPKPQSMQFCGVNFELVNGMEGYLLKVENGASYDYDDEFMTKLPNRTPYRFEIRDEVTIGRAFQFACRYVSDNGGYFISRVENSSYRLGDIHVYWGKL